MHLQRNQPVCEGDNSAKDYFADEILFRHRHFGGWLAGFRQRRGFSTLVKFHSDNPAPAIKHVNHANAAFVVSNDDKLRLHQESL